jgi:hypothetical protein
LADDHGSSLVGFIQSGTGAVARTLQDKNRDTLSVVDFAGADPTGVNDSTDAIQNAATAAAGRTLVASGTFRISGALNLRSVRLDFTAATLVLDAAAPTVMIGGNAATTINQRQQLKRVYRSGGATATPTLRVCGTKDQFIDVELCDYLQIYADTATNPAQDGSVAYCTFNFGYIAKLEMTNNPANTAPGVGVGGNVQWINENVIQLQRCTDFSISGTYAHNHNRVTGGTFEGTSSIRFYAGTDNYIYQARFEGTPTVTFDAGTERNTVLNTWDSSSASFATTSATVVDNGLDNLCMDDFLLYHHEQQVAYTDIADVVLDTQVSPFASPRVRDLQRIYHGSAGQNFCLSPPVSVNTGDYFRWSVVSPDGTLDTTIARYRPRIEFYDAKLQPVASSAGFISSAGGVFTVVTSNAIVAGSDVAGAFLVLLPAAFTAGVRFAKVMWQGNSPAVTTKSNAVQMYVSHFAKKSDTYRGIPMTVNRLPLNGILVSGIPTQGFAPAGYSAIKSDAAAKYVNKFAFESTTTGANAGGATVIAITAGTGTANADIVGVNQDDGSTHWTTIASGGGTASITLTAGLASASAAGSRIVFNRWATY